VEFFEWQDYVIQFTFKLNEKQEKSGKTIQQFSYMLKYIILDCCKKVLNNTSVKKLW